MTASAQSSPHVAEHMSRLIESLQTTQSVSCSTKPEQPLWKRTKTPTIQSTRFLVASPDLLDLTVLRPLLITTSPALPMLQARSSGHHHRHPRHPRFRSFQTTRRPGLCSLQTRRRIAVLSKQGNCKIIRYCRSLKLTILSLRKSSPGNLRQCLLLLRFHWHHSLRNLHAAVQSNQLSRRQILHTLLLVQSPLSWNPPKRLNPL